jgi:hypothetical protein
MKMDGGENDILSTYFYLAFLSFINHHLQLKFIIKDLHQSIGGSPLPSSRNFGECIDFRVQFW